MTDFSPPPLRLTFAGQPRPLVSLETFRAAHDLPETFGVALFESEAETIAYHPIWSRQAILQALHEVLTTAVPHRIPLPQLTQLPQMLALLFQNELIIRGGDTELLRDDVEQVGTDLQNILEPAAYKLIELYYQNGQDNTAVAEKFDMLAIYQEVLDSTVQLSTAVYEYPHQGEMWQVHLIYTVYGTLGLHITTAVDTHHYVADPIHAFPAHHFLAATGITLGQSLCDGFVAT